MLSTLRLWAALLLVAVVALPARAQEDDEARDEDEIVIERDGDVYRFRIPDFDGEFRRKIEGDHARLFRADTVIDGRNVIRFRTPDGEGEVFEFEMPEFDGEAFRMHMLPELERFRTAPPDLFFDHDGEPLGLLPFREGLDVLRLHEGLSEETREEMMELERRARELADEARRADGREREEAERALEGVLGELFEVRGRMREEQAARLEEHAEELRREAEELRESLRDRDRERRALIEERMRELLGERGSDW